MFTAAVLSHLTAFPSCAERIRDWQYPQDPSALRTLDGQTIITDDALLKAEQLLPPFAHFVCSWTGAQMPSRPQMDD